MLQVIMFLEGLHHAMNHSKNLTASRQLTTKIKVRSLCGRSWAAVGRGVTSEGGGLHGALG